MYTYGDLRHADFSGLLAATDALPLPTRVCPDGNPVTSGFPDERWPMRPTTQRPLDVFFAIAKKGKECACSRCSCPPKFPHLEWFDVVEWDVLSLFLWEVGVTSLSWETKFMPSRMCLDCDEPREPYMPSVHPNFEESTNNWLLIFPPTRSESKVSFMRMIWQVNRFIYFLCVIPCGSMWFHVFFMENPTETPRCQGFSRKGVVFDQGSCPTSAVCPADLGCHGTRDPGHSARPCGHPGIHCGYGGGLTSPRLRVSPVDAQKSADFSWGKVSLVGQKEHF